LAAGSSTAESPKLGVPPLLELSYRLLIGINPPFGGIWVCSLDSSGLKPKPANPEDIETSIWLNVAL
jgi:hypothetical protein